MIFSKNENKYPRDEAAVDDFADGIQDLVHLGVREAFDLFLIKIWKN